jgi:hypothetical protein
MDSEIKQMSQHKITTVMLGDAGCGRHKSAEKRRLDPKENPGRCEGSRPGSEPRLRFEAWLRARAGGNTQAMQSVGSSEGGADAPQRRSPTPQVPKRERARRWRAPPLRAVARTSQLQFIVGSTFAVSPSPPQLAAVERVAHWGQVV